MSRLRLIRLVVCDVDGVLTDGGLHYGEDGHVSKRFDVRDGLAVRMLQRSGISMALLSGGRSGAIEQRARHLDIQYCRVGVEDKQAALEQLRYDLGFARDQTAFIGDDLNDLVVKPVTGILAATADADPFLRFKADFVLSKRGGEGAVREFCEAILSSRGLLKSMQRNGWRELNT